MQIWLYANQIVDSRVCQVMARDKKTTYDPQCAAALNRKAVGLPRQQQYGTNQEVDCYCLSFYFYSDGIDVHDSTLLTA